MPPTAAAMDSAATRGFRSSPSTSSRLSSRATTKKNNVIKPSLIHSRDARTSRNGPIWMPICVIQRDRKRSAQGELESASASAAARSRIAPLAVSIRRKRASGLASASIGALGSRLSGERAVWSPLTSAVRMNVRSGAGRSAKPRRVAPRSPRHPPRSGSASRHADRANIAQKRDGLHVPTWGVRRATASLFHSDIIHMAGTTVTKRISPAVGGTEWSGIGKFRACRVRGGDLRKVHPE